MRQFGAHIAEAYRHRDFLACLLADTKAQFIAVDNLSVVVAYVLRQYRNRRALEWKLDAGPWLRAVIQKCSSAIHQQHVLDLLVVRVLDALEDVESLLTLWGE
jgi:hypothetical protein